MTHKLTRHETPKTAMLKVFGATALAFLLLLGIAASASAQTALNCTTAARAIQSSDQAGKDLRLKHTYDDIETVTEILRTVGLESQVGHADTVQVFHIEPDNYMIMASIQGCHVGHVFADESIVSAVAAIAVASTRSAFRRPSDGLSRRTM